jgi:regulator of protease activity HflC (stomatin/prohibitin superfamily)
MRADELTPGPPTDPAQPPKPHALDPAAPPRWVRRAGEWNLILLASAAATAVVALAAVALACFPAAIPALAAPGLLAALAGAAALAFAALLSSWLVANARIGVAHALEHLALAAERRARGEASVFADGDEGVGLDGAIGRLQSQAFWPQPLVVVPIAALAAYALVRLWPQGAPGPGALALGLGALVLAFPVLVLERRLAAAESLPDADADPELPDARGLAAILRLLLATLVVAGLAGLAATPFPAAATWAFRSLAALQLAVAAELAARGLFTLFLPAPAPGRARGCADSLVASLLVSGVHPLASLRTGLKERFHIDFGQSWALRFAAAAAGPVAVGILVLGWLLTAVTILPFGEHSQRGVLERFGAPVAVLEPGIHVHLPWPFAAVRRIEDGQVHELSLADETPDAADPTLSRAAGGLAGGTRVTLDGGGLGTVTAVTVVTPGPNPVRTPATILGATATTLTILTPPHAAGPVDLVLAGPDQPERTLPGAYTYLDTSDATPASYDRLWEKSHSSESFHLVPSPGADHQANSFQLLNGDLRVFWRVGTGQDQAIAAAYHLADPETIVASSVRRLVVAMLASRTVPQMVGADRQRFAADLRDALQADLDQRASGLEITAVAVDAIHPPTGAAAAYHGVQAAEIIANTDISAATSAALRDKGKADSRAQELRDDGAATAADLVAKANADANRFAADLAAYQHARDALRLERWLDVLGRALHNADLTIIDHRLPAGTPALLDLRPSTSAQRRE